jgi:foldase protein PrsA
MCRLVSRWSTFVVTALFVVGLAACGGASGGGSTSSATDSGGVVARVGGSAITAATVNRWLGIEERREKLVAPQFAACVARLRVALSASVAGTSAADAPKQSVAQLRSSCKALDQQLRDEALNRYVVGDWVTGGAQELGVDISGQAFQRKFAALIKNAFHTQARFHNYLASVGRNEADVRFQAHRSLDETAIRAAIKHRIAPVTALQVREYYEHHKSQYYSPQTRDLEIAAAPSKAASLAIRRKIAGGETFATVVKGLSTPQAVGVNKAGVVTNLLSGYYKEPALNNAIFTASPGTLIGPIKTEIGYFVFRLKKIHPAYQQPLSAVAASIKSTLPGQLEQQALAAYIKQWRAKWTARTDCSAAYVIAKCKQFKGTPGPREQDPYTLD